MRHRLAGRHLARTPAHHKAMRRNMAQSLFQYGQIETTLIKAKEIRPFVERLITLAKKQTLVSRQRIIAILGDRPALSNEEQEKYDAMSDVDRRRVMMARTGRRHRTGKVPASYNKTKTPFVATSVVHRLISEVAPKFADRPGGYTRIVRLAKRRIGDASDLAILQLVGMEDTLGGEQAKKTTSRRRQKRADRIRFMEGKAPVKKRTRGQSAKSGAASKPDASAETESAPKAE